MDLRLQRSLGLLCLLGLLMASPLAAAQDAGDWIEDGNVASSTRHTGVPSQDSCSPVRDQLHAREAQVNDLLSKQQAAEERSTQLDTQLQAARKRYSSAESQLKELHDTAQTAGTSEAAQAKKAETELAALRARLHAAEEQLKSQQTECGSTATVLQEAHAKVEAMTAELEAAKAAQKKLLDSSDLSSKADRKALKEAQSALSKAQADAQSANAALSQAQEEVLSSLQALDDWTFATLPSWVSTQYGKVSAAAAPHVQAVIYVAQPYWDSAYETLTPHTDVAYKHGSQYASQAYKVGGQYAQSAYVQGSQLFSSGKKRGFEAWVAAHPHIQKALARSQAFLRKLWADISSTLEPRFKVGSRSLERGMRSVRRQLHELTAHPQLVHMKRQMAQTWDELEGVVAQGLGRVKVLQPYARKPYITNVLYAVMAFPFVLLLGPLLLAVGASDKPPRRAVQSVEQSAESDTPTGVKTSPSSAAAPSGRRKSRGKQITEGGESVLYR